MDFGYLELFNKKIYFYDLLTTQNKVDMFEYYKNNLRKYVTNKYTCIEHKKENLGLWISKFNNLTNNVTNISCELLNDCIEIKVYYHFYFGDNDTQKYFNDRGFDNNDFNLFIDNIDGNTYIEPILK